MARGAKKAEVLYQLGADVVIDTSGPGVVERSSTETAGKANARARAAQQQQQSKMADSKQLDPAGGSRPLLRSGSQLGCHDHDVGSMGRLHSLAELCSL